MNILFIHQNFPGQFKFLAPALAQRGHQVVVFALRGALPKCGAGYAWNLIR